MLNRLQSVFHYFDHFKTIFKSLSYLIWNHFQTEQGRERWNSFSIWSAKIKLVTQLRSSYFPLFYSNHFRCPCNNFEWAYLRTPCFSHWQINNGFSNGLSLHHGLLKTYGLICCIISKKVEGLQFFFLKTSFF